jgi:hypothetical protein
MADRYNKASAQIKNDPRVLDNSTPKIAEKMTYPNPLKKPINRSFMITDLLK